MQRRQGIFLGLLICFLLMLCSCQKREHIGEEVRGFEKWTLVQEDYLTFADGVKVSQWRNESGEQERFQLSDGTDLMLTSIITRFVPETSKKGLTGIEDLPEEVQKCICSYYEEQGLAFEIEEHLQAAYDDFEQCTVSGEHFTAHTIRQEVMPTAENDTYAAFLTALTLPKQAHFSGDTVCRYDGRIFSRTDGTQIDPKDLFVLKDWDKVKRELSIVCANDDTTISEAEIYDAMDQADILVFQDYLEIYFPYGTWEKQEFDKGFGIKYDRLTDLLEEWAFPSEEDREEA